MAEIVPFTAVRPTPDKVSLVTCRSYEDYSSAELAAQLDFNPLSFLHVLNPAYSSVHQMLAPEKRFRQVSQKYQEFRNDHILQKDEKPAFYIHRIATKSRIYTGIIVGTSVEDYKNDVIKRHEDTIAYRVQLFKDYLKYSGFNTEPVLMTYPDNPLVGQWIREKTEKPADFEFSTTRQDIHYLWKVDDQQELSRLQEIFAEIGNLYIADGHHRSASAELLYDEGKSDTRKYFMSFLISESNVRIYEFNRLIKSLNGLSKSDLLKQLSECFLIETKPLNVFQPTQRHEFGMYMGNEFYKLTLKSEKCVFNTPLDKLDAQILYDKVLAPVLGIVDLRNDVRIEYVPGKHPVRNLYARVDSGEFALAFILYPAGIDEIKAIADAHMIMPPKTTYIEPKFRSGLVVYEL
ncbi:MAG: DUF1015 domain-containing protein [Flavobacterium sp.]|nr:MAG: DUF1015 domain-containing protein [Flavobacterium sp.]